jgi:short-subunit dehydrogenase involved in D-alanine esterification of teichoic acids
MVCSAKMRGLCSGLTHFAAIVLITGTSMNGIGFETARAIAKHANVVIITGYHEERSVFTSVGNLLYRIEKLKLD